MTRLGFVGATLMVGLTACVVRSGPPPDGRHQGGFGPGGPPPSGPAYAPPALGPETFIVPEITSAFTYEGTYERLRSLGVTGDIVFQPAAVPSNEMRVHGIDRPGRTESTRVPIFVAVRGANPTDVVPMLSLLGMPVVDAITKFTNAGYFGFTVRHVLASNNCQKGMVCAQTPNVGESTRRGDVAKMIVVAVE